MAENPSTDRRGPYAPETTEISQGDTMAERQLSYRGAINEALRLEMRRDSTVVVMGEDVSGAPHSDNPTHFDAWVRPRLDCDRSSS